MKYLNSLWEYILISSPFLMLGLLLSGFIYVFISIDKIKGLMSGSGIWNIIKASILGIPLPLCSCAVIPTAITLKKNGASNASTSSFLISTPESSIDSIAMTYGIMDLPMTIIRPVSAFISAFFAGILQMIFNKFEYEPPQSTAPCCSKSSANLTAIPFSEKLKKVFKFAYIDLIDDFAKWLLLGIMAGALIDFIIPTHFFENLNGMSGKLLILLAGIPLYICASATTPIAASLIMKGMSPGTALIFLLVGPATNISSIIILSKYIGKKGVFLNIVAIIIASLLLGVLVDYLYLTYSWPINFKINEYNATDAHWSQVTISIIFCLLMIKSIIKVEIYPFLKKSKIFK